MTTKNYQHTCYGGYPIKDLKAIEILKGWRVVYHFHNHPSVEKARRGSKIVAKRVMMIMDKYEKITGREIEVRSAY